MVFSIKARLKSFTYAVDGFAHMLRTQHNAWLHLVATAVVIVLGFGLHVDADAWRWLIVAMALVWVAEAMNTAFEHVCDVMRPELHEFGQALERHRGGIEVNVPSRLEAFYSAA